MLIKYKHIAYLLFFLGSPVFADILDVAEFERANLNQLHNDHQLFQAINIGLNLSIIRCMEDANCKLNNYTSEIKSLIGALDSRIDNLKAREQSKFGSILTEYIKERDNYRFSLKRIDLILNQSGQTSSAYRSNTVDEASLKSIEDQLSFFEDEQLADDEDEDNLLD